MAESVMVDSVRVVFIVGKIPVTEIIYQDEIFLSVRDIGICLGYLSSDFASRAKAKFQFHPSSFRHFSVRGSKLAAVNVAGVRTMLSVIPSMEKFEKYNVFKASFEQFLLTETAIGRIFLPNLLTFFFFLLVDDSNVLPLLSVA
eukprot:Lithocolla_globosa_v1_NODE_4302_length_1467_cov_128.479462.p1 type:complete len:144 gc:universal NODE_4302_length_1467_cov_128.479462:221-652(+)